LVGLDDDAEALWQALDVDDQFRRALLSDLALSCAARRSLREDT
jgi:hypothetical protein